MLTILLHSSKTMRRPITQSSSYQKPLLLRQATELAHYCTSLSIKELQDSMKLSETKALITRELFRDWSVIKTLQHPAIDVFTGDIYSGLQAQSFSNDDRAYANDTLYILSGLYGILRACDSIQAYRLEMIYKLPSSLYSNLYVFWGNRAASCIPHDRLIINLLSIEYAKMVLPHITNIQIVTPQFLTRDPHTGNRKFVTVHTKIARGAFAHWLIKHRIENSAELVNFNELNYVYDEATSSDTRPVFVCDGFGGLGLSVRLT